MAPLRWLVGGLLLVAVGLAGAQDRGEQEWLGRSPAEVVKMGRDAWVNLFTREVGSSTAALAGAESTFARARQVETDRQLGALPPARRQAIRSLRKHLTEFAGLACDVGAAISGGGTMWTITRASADADREEALAAMVGARYKPAPRRVVSDVTRAMNLLSTQISLQAKDIDMMEPSSGLNATKARERLNGMRREFSAIVGITRSLNRAESDRVLDFCLKWVKVADPDQ